MSDKHDMCHRDGCTLTGIPYGLASCGCWDTELRTRAEAAEAKVARLVAALRRIDAKNDNPACFNPEINVIVMAALEEQANG